MPNDTVISKILRIDNTDGRLWLHSFDTFATNRLDYQITPRVAKRPLSLSTLCFCPPVKVTVSIYSVSAKQASSAVTNTLAPSARLL